MSIENNSRPEETDEELKKWLTSTGLSGDSANIIMRIPSSLLSEIRDIQRLSPIRTYEEYIRTCGVHTPNEAERLIKISNNDSIKRLNQLIAEYNTDLPRIKAENDLQAAIDFYNKADELIRGDKAVKVSLDD
ncbi:MAG: hypothetical protein PHZ04_02245 [Patescibacteria group bacterium]|nr:hypothetical protein [Patescibacteria group bacterium]MDD5294314.1 hypothetical protein [Patescibacteria group bacterium]MDD5554137.1 hypothetical protein [Patescibacteria group bacterium]